MNNETNVTNHICFNELIENKSEEEQILTISNEELLIKTSMLNSRIDCSLSKINLIKEKLSKHILEKEKNKELKYLKDQVESLNKDRLKLLDDLENKENKCIELSSECKIIKEKILEKERNIKLYEDAEKIRVEKELKIVNQNRSRQILLDNIKSLDEIIKNY